MKPPAALKRAMKDALITPRGAALAAVIWAAMEDIFTAAGPQADPWEVMDVVSRLARCKAGDIATRRGQ